MDINYDAGTAMGQVLAEGIGSVIEGQFKIDRFYRTFRRMDADEALGELKIRNHAGFKKVLEAVRDALRDTDFEDNLYTLDQG